MGAWWSMWSQAKRGSIVLVMPGPGGVLKEAVCVCVCVVSWRLGKSDSVQSGSGGLHGRQGEWDVLVAKKEAMGI